MNQTIFDEFNHYVSKNSLLKEDDINGKMEDFDENLNEEEKINTMEEFERNVLGKKPYPIKSGDSIAKHLGDDDLLDRYRTHKEDDINSKKTLGDLSNDSFGEIPELLPERTMFMNLLRVFKGRSGYNMAAY